MHKEALNNSQRLNTRTRLNWDLLFKMFLAPYIIFINNNSTVLKINFYVLFLKIFHPYLFGIPISLILVLAGHSVREV